jgi:predicted AAA+ superfamily ATPase
MAITNQERAGKAMELLRAGLAPFVEREIQSAVKTGSVRMDAIRRFAEAPLFADKPIAEWDVAGLLKLMAETWNEVFRKTLGFSERSIAMELREWRNKWAHQKSLSSDDAYRVFDSVGRLLAAVSAPQVEEVEKLKQELLRVRFDEQTRGEKRKVGGSLIEAAQAGNLKPWREVVTPHPDVASGRFQQAEFAADLQQVHLGEGSDEYLKPAEFFRRTYLTESLKHLLVGAAQRLSGEGGDPVVQLQTNFGGGKTHSMLALYHLFSGEKPSALPGVDTLLAEAGISALPPSVRRVVLVGNRISPGNPATKPDGTVVRTLWGELAWQLGGKKAFARIRGDDEHATSPGDALRELFKTHGPCLILIDEWVAYARQLHEGRDLPGGDFETQFSFAQALTESAKLAGNCLLVVSLPASDTSGSPHTQGEDVEVGGLRGREALDRLRNVIGRVESSWRPASAEEGFEIVRRRLFEALPGPDAYRQRDVTARAFADLYAAHAAEFPAECRSADYEKRIQAAYPIHPEIFDRLYGDWSTLAKFQRTRGVLRLMATVIHSLWQQGDRAPLILPASIPIADARVQFELTRYVSDNWVPIIARDVDGAESLPLRIDGEQPNLGKYSATRRVARAIYLGSAPQAQGVHRGIEDRRIKLGCVLPSESPAVFGDALRRLAASATYLYQDGQRFWYDTQPTVTKLAEDRAEQLARDPDKVSMELERRLRVHLQHDRGGFAGIHPLPRSGADVPDELTARLVVLGPEHPHTREEGSAAQVAAKAIWQSRGNAPRLYLNTLVFLAADKARLQDLDEALRRYLAWQSILDEKESLDLSPFQARQAETQRQAADGAIEARLPETYQWLLVPEQTTPQAPMVWKSFRLNSSDGLAARAFKRLRADEALLLSFGASMLRKLLDDVPLWRAEHVPVRQLIEDFARYPYLPRLANPQVLLQTVRDGVSALTWQADTFAWAEGYDERAQRYLGLCGGRLPPESGLEAGLLVEPDVAHAQMLAAQEAMSGSRGIEDVPVRAGAGSTLHSIPLPDTTNTRQRLQRFHGTVTLDPTRVGRDAGRVAEEVLAHLLALPGAQAQVFLEVQVSGFDDVNEQVQRTVTENARTLKFEPGGGFESE